MNKLVFAIALCMIVPALRAQQAETSGNPPQAAPDRQKRSRNRLHRIRIPRIICPRRSGRAILSIPRTSIFLPGNDDREIAAAQRAAVPYSVGMYGTYGDPYAMQGRFGRGFDIPMLPLARISNPFFVRR